ncbi:MAG: hypothetical protein GY722_28915 [bacterium]|nr:hypothetical protein [bacterium]
MSLKILLAEAIRSGELGPVRLGMTKEEVRRALGAPDDVMRPSRRRRESPCWLYGDVEVYFPFDLDRLVDVPEHLPTAAASQYDLPCDWRGRR